MTEELNSRLPRKNPHHYSKRVGVVDPDGVANLLHVVGLGRDGTSHGTRVRDLSPVRAHSLWAGLCPEKLVKKIPMAVRAGVELGASGFQVQSSDHIGHAISSILRR